MAIHHSWARRCLVVLLTPAIRPPGHGPSLPALRTPWVPPVGKVAAAPAALLTPVIRRPGRKSPEAAPGHPADPWILAIHHPGPRCPWIPATPRHGHARPWTPVTHHRGPGRVLRWTQDTRRPGPRCQEAAGPRPAQRPRLLTTVGPDPGRSWVRQPLVRSPSEPPDHAARLSRLARWRWRARRPCRPRLFAALGPGARRWRSRRPCRPRLFAALGPGARRGGGSPGGGPPVIWPRPRPSHPIMLPGMPGFGGVPGDLLIFTPIPPGYDPAPSPPAELPDLASPGFWGYIFLDAASTRRASSRRQLQQRPGPRGQVAHAGAARHLGDGQLAEVGGKAPPGSCVSGG